MEEYRVKALRARKERCAEVGLNCGEPQNGAAGGSYNYRIWKEIGAIARARGNCEQ
jgi:hypothetical protein